MFHFPLKSFQPIHSLFRIVLDNIYKAIINTNNANNANKSHNISDKSNTGNAGNGLELIIKLYKVYDNKTFYMINTMDGLKNIILNPSYYGNLVDIYLLSYIYKINVIIIDKRIDKYKKGLHIIEQPNSIHYILLYTYTDNTAERKKIYNIVEKEGKYVFEKYDFTDRFRALVDEQNKNDENNDSPPQEPVKKKIKIKSKSPIIKKIKIKKK